MKRRRFLAAGTALSIATLAGCTGEQAHAGVGKAPTASLKMRPISDIEIAKEVTYGEDLNEKERQHELVTAAINDESTTTKGTEPPFPEHKPFVFDNAVYELSYEIVESQPATSFQITLNPVEGSIDDAEAIQYRNLPPVDQDTFQERGWDEMGFLGFGTSILYLDEKIPGSVLVPDPEYTVIVWDDETRGRFTVDGSYDTDLNTYQYSSAVVSDSAEKYGERVRQDHVFEFSGLSEKQRGIVSEAIDSEHGYVVPHEKSLPDAMAALVEQFRSQDEVDWVWEDGDENRTVSGRYLVRYDSDVYWTRIRVSQSSSSTAGQNQ